MCCVIPNERVVIVEDERIIARYLGHLLGRAGYRVVATVACGAEVLEAIARHQPAVVILDISMETRTMGLDIAETMLIPESTSIVFVSGTADRATIQRVRRVPRSQLVTKPFSAEEVLSAVRLALADGAGQVRSP